MLLFTFLVKAQTNLSGKPGLLYVPSAVATDEGMFKFGYNYNPKQYALRGSKLNAERILFANLTLLPRLEININLLQKISTPSHKTREAIGDRQLDIRYLILKETKKRPSLAMILSTPFTRDAALLTHVLVATKNFELSKALIVEASVGYGSPYFLYRDVDLIGTESVLSGFKWQQKSTYLFNNHYLVGPFGGVIMHYRKKAGVMLEYDSKHLNVGAYATLFKRWTVQAGLLNGDQIMFGTSFGANLLKLPKQIRKK
ncbi:YjbH domain-containing protein [Runella sp.]|uniref:YjbH domain-containing protein n=1 Tax=Runella sp. TaxID=1960881 RepID=UPI003D0F7EB6